MGWRGAVFGSERPTVGRVTAIAFAAFMLAWLAYGLWVDFQPEPWVRSLGLYPSVVLGVATATWLVWVNLSGRNEQFSGDRVALMVYAPLAALMGTGLYWYVLTSGMTAAATRVFGRPASTIVQFVTETNVNGCRYRAYGHVDRDYTYFHLCIPEAYYLAHPNRKVEMELTGYRSAFGFYVTGFEHRRDLGRRGY
ncbi:MULTISPECIES: hypothetical protein [Dyella]|uniref:Uncharacterized protein n=2 Tax=Dyella TaxID=231454 RepID=A0A4R0Z2G6_9GAMM|nr:MULTISPECIES: hypothetical protein [Dyella]TBR38761.1 hypothetical protein EYV96_00440 [Dyella terrae]TCI13648.1 hypothetical protein EZM97_10430 [Dyella soli]